MPGLFDSLKEGLLGGLFGVFTGPQDPRVAPGTGQREGLISAGLATLASQSQDPLEAIAQGAMVGRQAGQAARERSLMLQQRAALQEFLSEVGFDRDGLISGFVRTLAAGDFEGAKAFSEIIKSVPFPDTQPSVVNRQRVETTASAAAGAPPEIVARFGEGTPVQVQQDPRTGQVFWESTLPMQPPTDPYAESFVEPNESSPTGAYRIGIRRDTGQREIIGLAPPPGGTGGDQARTTRNLAAAMQQAEGTLSTVDEELANPVVAILGNIARGGGVTGALANSALGAIRPQGQMAMAAADQWTAATVRLLSGAQMTEIERQGYRAAYLPLAGEDPSVQRQKAAARGALAALFAEGDEVTTGDLDMVLQQAGLPAPAMPSPAGPVPGVDLNNPFAHLIPADTTRGPGG